MKEEGAVLTLCVVFDLKHNWSKLRECKSLLAANLLSLFYEQIPLLLSQHFLE